MPLSAGTKLGPYEILGPLGAGGMGEVYRARDTRLGREVAIKVLPPGVANDQDRLARFEQEARSASALNHPAIITIHEIGSVDSTSYIAMELVEGVSLRQMLTEGAIPSRKAIGLAVQLADGLAKAHAAGIVHRDLKPENIMISKDGFAKILDFGLAKLAVALSEKVSELRTMAKTDSGTVLGTVGYMSPEQASGKQVDFRSDQFSFGSILYEMLTGKKAFQRNTAAETLTAIIREEPEPIASLDPQIPAPVRWIVERCLAKDPEDRYQNTRDLARDLQSIRDHFSEMTSSKEQASVIAPPVHHTKLFKYLTFAGIAASLILAAALWKQVQKRKEIPASISSYHRLTYQKGNIDSARFATDGHTVIYSAAWQGNPIELFLTRTKGVGSQAIGISGARVLSISKSGEMLILLPYKNRRGGTLAQVPLTGGAPRPLYENILGADWGPDGLKMAIVREIESRAQVEFPVGKVIYETDNDIRELRISPKADFFAFVEHLFRDSSEGQAVIVDLTGKKTAISKMFYPNGLSWSVAGEEVWFTTLGSEQGSGSMLYALPPMGHERLVQNFNGLQRLRDITPDGRVLLTSDDRRVSILGFTPSETIERDLSWLDHSQVEDLSADGKVLLFSERGDGSEAHGTMYYRKTDGSPALRLGEGVSVALSPDGQWALSFPFTPEMILLPLGAGEQRSFPVDQFEQDFGWADWLPDSKRFVFYGREKGQGWRLYTQDIAGGKPRAITPMGVSPLYSWAVVLSPDGKFVIAVGKDQKIYQYPVEGGEPKLIPGLTVDEEPIQWSADGRSLFLYKRAELPARIYKFNIATGQREFFKELMPADPSGVTSIYPIRFTPDAKYYAYSCWRFISTLYIASGLK